MKQVISTLTPELHILYLRATVYGSTVYRDLGMELHDFSMHRARCTSTRDDSTHGMFDTGRTLPLVCDVVLKTQYYKPYVCYNFLHFHIIIACHSRCHLMEVGT